MSKRSERKAASQQRPANTQAVPLVDVTKAASSPDEADESKRKSKGKGSDPQRMSSKELEAATQIEVKVGDIVVHRAPTIVASSLRYLLAGGEIPHRLSVTSAIHGEGVTAISRTLAALIAYDWRRTACWVDLNWWKNASGRAEQELFPMTIAGVLDGTGVAADLPMATSVPGLSMVMAGDVPVSARSRLPKSERLAQVIDDLARSFDYVILDLPPVLASSDTLTLGNFTDGYLLVVRQRATSSAQVRAALRTMNTIPCLGTVLNGVQSNVPRWLRTSDEIWAYDSR